MVQSQFSLSWDSYKSSICSGFSALQQNGEFVDMTLAADGHHVKVHQVLMALASPYLKELISTAPCQHPVIFLNKVSHKSLSLILEYIYTGEVLVPADYLSSFMETAKALHIKGLDNMISDNIKMTRSNNVTMPKSEDSLDLCHVSGVKNLTIPTATGGVEQLNLPASARKIVLKHEELSDASHTATDDNMNDYAIPDDTHMLDSDDDHDQTDNVQATTSQKQPSTGSTPNFQFTVSIRGSLQVILNRYIYNLHSVTHRTGTRRWRCVDYRNNKCTAFVVTKDNVVINRANLHNHPFHDKKILQKIENNAVYSTLDDVESYKQKEFATKDAEGPEIMIES